MQVKRHSKNIHEIIFDKPEVEIAMLSDLHWDNPKCDREQLTSHLDYCKANEIPVVINGDFFCLMQGKGDKRGNKSDVLPEHNNARYLDSIVETAVEWFSPYADIIKVIGYGNHETAIIKWQETDILQRFVDLLNYKNSTSVYTSGYGGWIVVKNKATKHSTTWLTTRIKHFHGSGGGGVVTKGALNLTRALEMYENMDVFTMGHIHENAARTDVREALDFNSKLGYKLKQRYIHLMLTGTYKEEYGEGSHGWHVERGAPVKPIGGRILKIKGIRKTDSAYNHVDSYRFPI